MPSSSLGSRTLEVCNQSLRETKRKTYDEKCWISLARGRKHSAAGDVEIGDGVHGAVCVDDA